MAPKNLAAWLHCFRQHHRSRYESHLDDVRDIASQLDLLTPHCQTVIVGGTNGKGSVVYLLESILKEAGYSVGAYTSPYLVDFKEQIRVDQQWVNEAALCDYFEAIAKTAGDTYLNEFEYKTLAALMHFQQQSVDVMLLEVGIGGLHDTVNLIDADVAVITSIGLDHVNLLGATKEEIGLQKAGIFRQNQVIICGEPNPPASLVSQASSMTPHYLQIGRDFDEKEVPNDPTLQAANVACAFMAAEYVLGRVLTPTQQATALRLCHVPGRLQTFERPEGGVTVDVAHNEDSAKALARSLTAVKGPVTAIFSILHTKDAASVVACMAPVVNHWVVVPLEDNPSAMKVEALASVLQGCDVSEEISAATALAKYWSKQGHIVVFGSFQVAGEALIYLTDLSKNSPNLLLI